MAEQSKKLCEHLNTRFEVDTKVCLDCGARGNELRGAD